MKAKPPHRVDVPFGKRPPKGVLWAGGELLLYHAQRRHYSRLLGCEVGPEPARLEEFRELVRGYVSGRGDMPAPLDAIGKTLNDAMGTAVSNGANSVSMPDHYVEVAAWLCGIGHGA